MSLAPPPDTTSSDDARYWVPGHDAPQHLRAHVIAIFRIGFTVTPSGCWEYNGFRNPKGYGRLTARVSGKVVTKYTHRVLYEYLVGPFPEDLPFALHSCDNPPCCNPAHIRPGTHEENMREMAERGHSRRARTHCPANHEYTPENVYWGRSEGRTVRLCRTCRSERQRRWREKRGAR